MDIDLSRLDLAMASRWHKAGEDAHQETIPAQAVAKWLCGCVRYTLSQIEYLLGKGKAPHP
jgi:hypothetical protein